QVEELNRENNDEFETVPKELQDEDTRATTLALAKKLLRKKARVEFVDNAFNRNAFNDEDLPKWFTDDELKARQPNLPITKEEVMKEKELMRELNARPIKKVLEAKLRKKQRKRNKLQKVQEKAMQIADNHEMTAREKQIELEKLYKEATKENRKKTVYVVSSKG